MQKTLFAAMLLLSASAQADVFKCKTANGGIAYSEHPCAAGEAEGRIRSSQGSGQGGALADVNAVPLPNPQKQRDIYQQFLATPSPRAFLICRNGGVSLIKGGETGVKREIARMASEGCAPYAINDDVVWKGN